MSSSNNRLFTGLPLTQSQFVEPLINHAADSMGPLNVELTKKLLWNHFKDTEYDFSTEQDVDEYPANMPTSDSEYLVLTIKANAHLLGMWLANVHQTDYVQSIKHIRQDNPKLSDELAIEQTKQNATNGFLKLFGDLTGN